MKKFLFCILLLMCEIIFSQTVDLEFVVKFEKEKFELNKYYNLDQLNKKIKIQKLQFYVGDFVFNNVENLKNNYFLIDLNNQSSLKRKLISSFKDIEDMKFQLGVPAEISEYGVGEGELDPLHDMYWTWHTGYINVKIEGIYIENGVEKEVTLHLGGFKEPFNSSQLINLKPIKTLDNQCEIVIHLDIFLKSIDLNEVNQIMKPCRKSVELMQLFSKSFQ